MPDLAQYPSLDKKLAELEEYLPTIVREGTPELQRVGEAFIRTRGKRIRPVVALLAAEMTGYQGNDDVRLGAVVELIHLATLVHDDILDESRLRRGERSVNFAWGNELAVLFGDYLYTKAMDEAIGLGRLDILQTLCGTTVEMIQGELVQHYRRGALELTEEQHLEIVRRKTAYLLAACARLGGRLAGVSEEDEKRLWTFGLNFGVAFQLVDDLLDYTASEADLGKTLLTDLAEGKVTLPFLCLTMDGSPRLRELLRNVIGDPDKVRANRDDILRLSAASSGIAEARAKAEAFAREAKASLAPFPRNAARGALEALTDYILTRRK